MAKITATSARNPGVAAKSYKPDDGDGLYLFANTKGARYWSYHCRFADVQKALSLGIYPEVRLTDKRERHASARDRLVNNCDRIAQKKLRNLYVNVEASNKLAAASVAIDPVTHASLGKISIPLLGSGRRKI